MKNSYCVYVHTNKINGKKYVGQTIQKPEARWDNGYGYKTCTKFQRAINKYGWDNFEHEIIQDNLTQEEANKLEIKLIAEYDCINNGYNIKLGGSNSYNPLSCIPVLRYDMDGGNPQFYLSRAEAARDVGLNNSAAIEAKSYKFIFQKGGLYDINK